MNLSDSEKHAIKYCKFLLDKNGLYADKVIICLSDYMTTGEGYTRATMVYTTELNDPVNEVIPEVTDVNQILSKDFIDACQTITKSRYLLDNREELYISVREKLKATYKDSDSYFVQYPALIMNGTYFLKNDDSATGMVRSCLPNSIVKNISNPVGVLHYYSYLHFNAS